MKKDKTESKTFRFTPEQMEMLSEVRKTDPLADNDAEALRVIFERAKGTPLPVPIVSAVGPVKDVEQFTKDVKVLRQSVLNLRSCLAGELRPEAYLDPQMQESIADIRRQAEELPDELRRLNLETGRIASLLRVGLNPKDLKVIRMFQRMYRRQIEKSLETLEGYQPEERAKKSRYYAALENQILPLFQRLFGPPSDEK